MADSLDTRSLIGDLPGLLFADGLDRSLKALYEDGAYAYKSPARLCSASHFLPVNRATSLLSLRKSLRHRHI